MYFDFDRGHDLMKVYSCWTSPRALQESLLATKPLFGPLGEILLRARGAVVF